MAVRPVDGLAWQPSTRSGSHICRGKDCKDLSSDNKKSIDREKIHDKIFRKKYGCYIEPDILHSKAYASLSRKHSIRVLTYFLSKQIRLRKRGKPKRKKEYFTANQGRITFSYAEAASKGIGSYGFRDALDELIEKGFIDITHSGGAYEMDVSRYAISDRYKKYGQHDFIKVERPKDTRRGQHWKKSKPKKAAPKPKKVIPLKTVKKSRRTKFPSDQKKPAMTKADKEKAVQKIKAAFQFKK